MYAETKGKDRRKLWNNLRSQKKFTDGKAWVIMGDMNVGLKVEDSSMGVSNMTRDMI